MTYQRDYRDPLRVGLVGAGSHAYRNVLPTLHYLPTQLVAVCDVDEHLASITAREYGAKPYSDLSSMLEEVDLDAVLICVSAELHPSLAITALRAGVHVWLEKPAAARAGDILDMIAERGDRVCMVGYKKAFMPATRKAVELLRSHRPLRSILARYPVSVPSGGSDLLARRERSMWLESGCHPISFMLEVGGQVRQVTTIRGQHGGGVCILEFENGAVGNLHLAEGAPTSQPFEQYSCFGDNCSVEITNSSRLVYQRGIPFDYGSTTEFSTPGVSSGAVVWEAQNGLNTLENKAIVLQGVYDELMAFCQRIRDPGSVNGFTGSLEFALAVTRVYEAAVLSEGLPIFAGPSTGDRE